METPAVEGIVYSVSNEQIVSPKYKKRELIIQTQEKYPQYITVQFSNDKCDLLNNLKKGEGVKVNINLRGRLWTDPKNGVERCFNTIEAWSISYISIQQTMTPPAQEKRVENYPETPKQPESNSLFNQEDDLPF